MSVVARRSPLNARYQKNTAPAGKTRKSASAAKPKREAGGHAPAAPAKKKQTFREAMANQPSTPEMKRWRMIWFGLIAGAFLAALVAWLVPAAKQTPAALTALTVLYVACLGGAIYIDTAIIRKLRREAAEAAKSEKKK